jgi:hypothetical protein
MVILLLTGDNLRTIAEVVESSERSKNDTKNQQTSTATTTTSDRKDDLKKEEEKDKTGKKNKPVLPARLARLATSFNMPLSGLSPEQAQIAEKTIYEFFAAASQKAVISANDKKKSDQPGVDVAKASASNANSTKKEKNNNQKS